MELEHDLYLELSLYFRGRRAPEPSSPEPADGCVLEVNVLDVYALDGF